MEKIDLEKLSLLACLEIEECRKQALNDELCSIITMVKRLPELYGECSIDRSNTMELREDIALPSLGREEFLSVVPNTAAGCILLPELLN